jgi:hypothetical protein
MTNKDKKNLTDIFTDKTSQTFETFSAMTDDHLIKTYYRVMSHVNSNMPDYELKVKEEFETLRNDMQDILAELVSQSAIDMVDCVNIRMDEIEKEQENV